jgi:hypothetical protein
MTPLQLTVAVTLAPKSDGTLQGANPALPLAPTLHRVPHRRLVYRLPPPPTSVGSAVRETSCGRVRCNRAPKARLGCRTLQMGHLQSHQARLLCKHFPLCGTHFPFCGRRFPVRFVFARRVTHEYNQTLVPVHIGKLQGICVSPTHIIYASLRLTGTPSPESRPTGVLLARTAITRLSTRKSYRENPFQAWLESE